MQFNVENTYLDIIFSYVKSYKGIASLLLVNRNIHNMISSKLEEIDRAIDDNKLICIQNTAYTTFVVTRRLVKMFNYHKAIEFGDNDSSKEFMNAIKFMLTEMNFVVELDQNIVDRSVILWDNVRDCDNDDHNKILNDITKNYTVSDRIINFIGYQISSPATVDPMMGGRMICVEDINGEFRHYDLDQDKEVTRHEYQSWYSSEECKTDVIRL